MHGIGRAGRLPSLDPSVQALPQTSADFAAALALYEARPDKGYSLTDCRSMVALQALGVTEVLTNDRHYSQEGFAILFPTPGTGRPGG